MNNAVLRHTRATWGAWNAHLETCQSTRARPGRPTAADSLGVKRVTLSSKGSTKEAHFHACGRADFEFPELDCDVSQARADGVVTERRQQSPRR